MDDDRARSRRQGLRDGDEQVTEEPAVGQDAVNWSSWSNLWQVPAIALSLVVIAAALYVATRRAPENDFQGAFDRLDQLIANEQFDAAAVQLNEVLEPNLHEATESEQARFEATVGDWISLSQKAADLDLETNNRRIVEHYARAVDMGVPMEPARMERWAHAWISLGDIAEARRSLDLMEKLANDPDSGLDVRRRRNNVLRRIVEVSLQLPELSEESMMELLVGYRADPMLDDADQLWAIARQAQLRIESDKAEDAVAHLLLDMRRFEPRIESNPQLTFGELMVLLARGYYELGNLPYADFHIQEALDMIQAADPVRGVAMVLLGQIAVARGEWHDAFELFDEVVRDYPSTHAAIPALLGRAEVYSVLGDDQSSLDDYQKLRETLSGSGPRRDVTADVVGASLSDRHDAALTMAKLEPALSYILLTESLFSPSQLPEEFILRTASTSRQLAQNVTGDGSQLSPKQRYQANEHYKRAGDNYVRHARRLAGRPGADEFWADSLWLAADSYDLGGWHGLAGTHFIEYVAGRSEADPRRPDAVFRLAQAYHAEMDYDTAAQHYDQVLTEHPRSAVASRSHVPLARCLLLLDRRPEAEQHLLQVVSGQQHLEPDAQDYRDALIELGTLYYDDEDYVGAIERLDEAVRRYPDDPRMTEIRFRLADGYRRHAATLEAELELPGRSPGERDRLEKKRTENLETAQQLFTTIIESDSVAEQVLRYGYLYRADCAFDLGRYAEAVEYYDQVASRFTRHHSSMTALIQIVNCYSNLGDDNRARTAHRRALLRLKKLPDEAFDQDDSLLDRDAWERWLQNMPAGDVRPASANS